jgi:hypothetical protein
LISEGSSWNKALFAVLVLASSSALFFKSSSVIFVGLVGGVPVFKEETVNVCGWKY